MRGYGYAILVCATLLLSGITVFSAVPSPSTTIRDKEKIGTELTIYNQDLALVKEKRVLEIPAGTVSINFSDVTSRIDPTSVKFNPLDASGIRILEQNYEYDVINESKFFQRYLGEKIKLTDIKGDISEGYLIGVGENLILGSQPSGGQITLVKSSQIKAVNFPELPNGLVIRPTLVWLLQNPQGSGRHLVEVTYLTGGLSWKADYIVTVNQDDSRMNLTGWVTLDNQSGAEFHNTRLKLVAGDIHRVSAGEGESAREYLQKVGVMNRTDQGIEEKSFFEYHLYTLNSPTSIKNNQMKQVQLLTANAVPVEKYFVYEGAVDSKKVAVMLEFQNNTQNRLGIPIPKGKVRVEKADHEGSYQLVGEDTIDHTAKDEKVRINLGNAFDVVGDRIRLNVEEPSKKFREETYQITLKNHKTEVVTIKVIEKISQWQESKIIRSSHDYQKIDAGKIEYTIPVPADGQRVITYTVRYKI